MKNLVSGLSFTLRMKQAAIGFAACAFFSIASNHIAFGQWKQSTGFNSTMRGFFSYSPFLLVDVQSRNSPPASIDSLYASTDNGQTWIGFAPNGGVPLAAVVIGGAPVLIGTASYSSGGGSLTGILSYSNDFANHFQTWLPDTLGLPSSNSTNDLAGSLVTLGSTIFETAGNFGIYQQTAPGARWTPDTVGMTQGGVPYTVGSMVVSGNNIFAATLGLGIFVSTNQGASWSPANNGIPTVQTGLWAGTGGFALSGTSVFAMVEHTGFFLDSLFDFYRTNDNGQTWTKMNSTPLNVGVGVTRFAASGQTLFAASDSVINFSNDGGATWQQADQGLPNFGATFSNITSISVSGGNLVIGILTLNQIWYRPLSEFISSSVTPSTAADAGLNLTLSGNPALGSEVKAIYTLSNSCSAQVVLTDELGRDLRVLQSGRGLAGRNVVSFDPQSLAPGTYFIRIEANGMTAVQKLVITR